MFPLSPQNQIIFWSVHLAKFPSFSHSLSLGALFSLTSKVTLFWYFWEFYTGVHRRATASPFLSLSSSQNFFLNFIGSFHTPLPAFGLFISHGISLKLSCGNDYKQNRKRSSSGDEHLPYKKTMKSQDMIKKKTQKTSTTRRIKVTRKGNDQIDERDLMCFICSLRKWRWKWKTIEQLDSRIIGSFIHALGRRKKSFFVQNVETSHTHVMGTGHFL